MWHRYDQGYHIRLLMFGTSHLSLIVFLVQFAAESAVKIGLF